MEDNNSFFGGNMSPKNAMILGLVIGILGMGTIGFIVLASKMLKGDTDFAWKNQQAAVDPTPSAQAGNNNQPSAQAVANVDPGHFPLLGKSSAPVTVIEFADFRCPFCERFHNDSMKNIIKDYVNTGKVKVAFRSFAFLGQESTWAHEAAECANEQGKFWAFHDWLYENQAPESDTAYYSKANLATYAQKVGLNVSKFTSCLNSDKFASQVAADTQAGQQAGVNGTPTTFINGKAIVGAQPYSVVKAAIEAALAGK
jgi:protein-disulfide isomerase